MTTDAPAAVVRNNRWSRLLHTGTFVLTLFLFGTGWWLYSGHEGEPSVLARAFDRPDVEIHRQAGWALIAVFAAGLTIGIRAVVTFTRETVRIDRGDRQWFWGWPRSTITGRFAPHQGHFDPGQRLANLAFVVVLGTLVGTGIGLTALKGGDTFVWMLRLHRYATYALIPLTVGHLVIVSGILPGYRRVWRAMHLGGRVPRTTMRRIWPTELNNSTIESPAHNPSDNQHRLAKAEQHHNATESQSTRHSN